MVVLGRPGDKDVTSGFYMSKHKDAPPATSHHLYHCRHCNFEVVRHASRMRKHLLQCTKYLDHARTSGITNSITREVGIIANGQKTIPFPTLSAEQKEKLDRAAASVCYLDGHTFTLWDSPAMRDFLKLLNPVYKPPSRHAIGESLLNKTYDHTKQQITALLDSMKDINIITDESSNISQYRISNISVHTHHGILHYVSEDIGATRMDAAGCATWLKRHLTTLTNGNLSRINSVATDTCQTMLNMAELMQQSREFKHCFFIPCDSHGIQLLIKDLLNLSDFKEVLDQAQTIVKAFRRAPLQYARLRAIQKHRYKRHYALVLSVITRWGTQLRLIMSVIRSKDALRQYTLDYEAKDLGNKSNNAFEYIIDRAFWSAIEPLRELLEPIDEALRMSESSHSHLGHVVQRWDKILEHLEKRKDEFPDLATYLSPNGAFQVRYQRQLVPLHFAAYFLMPNNIDKKLPLHYERVIYNFLINFIEYEDRQAIWAEFQCFRGQLSPFEPERICWEHVDNVKVFWSSQVSNTRYLGRLCLRLFSTPVNSVGSEQAFSVQNLVQHKLRSSLQSTKTDKLVYIYRNGRVIHNLKDQVDFEKLMKKTMNILTEDDEVAVEQILLELDESVEESGIIESDLEEELMED